MFKIGKTDTSFESPNFFHIKDVPQIQHRKNLSHKLLRPELKLSCSKENPLLSPSLSQSLKPKEQFTYENDLFNASKKHQESKLSNSPHAIDSYNTRSSADLSYTSSYQKALESKGFKKEKSMFSGDFDTVKLLRSESNRNYLLKKKISNDNQNRLISDSSRYLPQVVKHKNHNYYNEHYEIFKQSMKKSRNLNNEIQDFEKRLDRIQKLPPLFR